MNLEPVYLFLGVFAFWGLVASFALIGSVYIAEWWKDRTYRREIGSVIDPHTKAQTDRLVREWRHLS